MGCCPSNLVDQGSLSRSASSTNQNTNQSDGSNRDHPTFPRAYYNKSKPFKRTGLLWTAGMPITRVELDRKRTAFWETAPSYGRRDMAGIASSILRNRHHYGKIHTRGSKYNSSYWESV
ncbi:uncharacterized protein ATC70_003056 [Mucor velutinosus]|uniref:Uncharacterized protein n=1 Tax=Mucor velutinosus TaxID=708070 RepID=A0AAN7D7P4_9FUNG|nr:hypothetical protein ATC70_003056 [Mucor velutinosus]